MATMNTFQLLSGEEGECVHFGATTQDIVDTAVWLTNLYSQQLSTNGLVESGIMR